MFCFIIRWVSRLQCVILLLGGNVLISRLQCVVLLLGGEVGCNVLLYY